MPKNKIVEANIVCLGARIETLVTSNNTFHEILDFPQFKDHALKVAVVEFENKYVQGRRVGVLDSVKAQLHFYDLNYKERNFIESGEWVREGASPISFEAGQRKKLVIGFWKQNEKEEFISVREKHVKSNSLRTSTFVVLNDSHLIIEVSLIAHGEIIKEVNLELILKSNDPNLEVPILKVYTS